jgi:hypothetical protein
MSAGRYDVEELHALAELGYALLDEGNLADASAVWAGLATVNAADEAPWRMLAVIAATEGRWDDAVPLATAAIERGATAPIVLLRAEALLMTGRVGDSLVDLEWLLGLGDGDETLAAVRRRARVVHARLRKPLAARAV